MSHHQIIYWLCLKNDTLCLKFDYFKNLQWFRKTTRQCPNSFVLLGTNFRVLQMLGKCFVIELYYCPSELLSITFKASLYDLVFSVSPFNCQLMFQLYHMIPCYPIAYKIPYKMNLLFISWSPHRPFLLFGVTFIPFVRLTIS